jgi:hypothetical protein
VQVAVGSGLRIPKGQIRKLFELADRDRDGLVTFFDVAVIRGDLIQTVGLTAVKVHST